MKESLLHLLDGFEKNVTIVDSYLAGGGIEPEIVEGSVNIDGKLYRIQKGVPAFYTDKGSNEGQVKTNDTIFAKWNVFMRENNEASFDYMLQFILKRLVPLGINSEEQFREFLANKWMIMDAGSGMGWMSEYMAKNTSGTVISVEIGDGVFAGYEKCQKYDNCHAIKAALMDLPFPDNTFDYIHSDGVLHHMPDTKLAMKALYDKVRPGGLF